MNPCYICRVDPTSHSFHMIDSSCQSIHLFYSCHAKATKYYERVGVVEHFRLHLEKNNNYPWAYILDCKDFTMEHASQILTSLELAYMVQTHYGKSLKKVWIINYTWMIEIVINTIMLILEDDLKHIIEITDKTIEEIQRIESV